MSRAEQSAPTAPGRDVRRWLRWLISRVWFWPTLATTALGIYHIGRPELWRDELRSWSAASRTVGQIWSLLGNTDAAAGLYYLVLHVWMQIFGQSATSMRLLSTVAMAASAAMVTLIGQRLFDKRTAIVAGLIFAVIPSVSRYAQEVRPYALTMLLATASTLLLLRLIDKPSYGRLVAYSVAIAGLALTQVVAVPLVLAHAVGVWLWRDRHPRLVYRWGAAALIGMVLAAPVAILSRGQYGHQVGSLPDATFGEIPLLPARLFASSLVAGAIIILALFAFTHHVRPAIFAAAWALLPIGAIWIMSHVGESYWMTRYMLFTLPGFALLAASAVAGLRTRSTVVVAAAVLLIATLGVQDQRFIRWVDSHDQWNYPDFSGQAVLYSDAARVIADNELPGDGIVYSDRANYWLLDIGMAYHLRGHPIPRDIFRMQGAVARNDFWVSECDQPARCLDPSVKRIWVLAAAATDVFPGMELGKRVLLEYYYNVEQRYFVSGMALELLQRKPGV